jgi:hypothetical protein
MDRNRSALYFELLQDLDHERVAETIDDLIASAGEELPTPAQIRARATARPAPEPVPAPDPVTDAATRNVEQERSARRPWLGILFGILGLFPLALWLGIKSHRERRRAIAEGREPIGDAWPPVTAITLGAIPLVALLVGATLALTGVILSDDGPNAGSYLTRSELEASIVDQGEFGSGPERLRALSANCVEDSTTGAKYRCIVDFRGGHSQSYAVTVSRDGNWVAEPTS